MEENATAQLIHETIEHDDKKRINAQAIVSRLQFLKNSSNEEERKIESSITMDELINNRQIWDFAEIWQVNKLSEEDGPTKFCDSLINKYPIPLKAPSFMVKRCFVSYYVVLLLIIRKHINRITLERPSPDKYRLIICVR